MYIYCVVENHGQKTLQAWSETTKKSMVRRTCVYHSVPNSAQKEVHLQDSLHYRRRNHVVACTPRMDKSNSSWSNYHLSKAWIPLPLSPPSWRGSNHIGYALSSPFTFCERVIGKKNIRSQ